ncbi:MAG: nucleoside phosphorylase [Acidobacteriota bacterium]|nr:nucleoside phosphorylase [Acidobacteriota bacterium]
MRVAILAALPGELKPLVQGWLRLPSPTRGIRLWTHTQGKLELTAVCGGMGSTAAMRSFAAAEHAGAPDMVLTLGWVGGLSSELTPGTCYRPSEVIDVQTGERFALAGGSAGLRLVTTPYVAGAAEKSRLQASYAAGLVDMEAAAVARLAQMRGIPVFAFKAISDGAGVRLPDINLYVSPAGTLRMGPFLAHVLPRPQYWAGLAHMGRSSALAARQIARAVQQFLADELPQSQPTQEHRI